VRACASECKPERERERGRAREGQREREREGGRGRDREREREGEVMNMALPIILAPDSEMGASVCMSNNKH